MVFQFSFQATSGQQIHYAAPKSNPTGLFPSHQNSGAYYESAASLRSSGRRALTDQRSARADVGPSTVEPSENTLGLRLHLQQTHFQSDVRLRCVAVYFKQMALFEETLRIATENPELLRASSHDLSANASCKSASFAPTLLL